MPKPPEPNWGNPVVHDFSGYPLGRGGFAAHGWTDDGTTWTVGSLGGVNVAQNLTPDNSSLKRLDVNLAELRLDAVVVAGTLPYPFIELYECLGGSPVTAAHDLLQFVNPDMMLKLDTYSNGTMTTRATGTLPGPVVQGSTYLIRKLIYSHWLDLTIYPCDADGTPTGPALANAGYDDAGHVVGSGYWQLTAAGGSASVVVRKVTQYTPVASGMSVASPASLTAGGPEVPVVLQFVGQAVDNATAFTTSGGAIGLKTVDNPNQVTLHLTPPAVVGTGQVTITDTTHGLTANLAVVAPVGLGTPAAPVFDEGANPDQEVRMTGAAVPGASGYQWYRSTDPTQLGAALAGKTDPNLLIDTTAAPATEYWYTLGATDGTTFHYSPRRYGTRYDLIDFIGIGDSNMAGAQQTPGQTLFELVAERLKWTGPRPRKVVSHNQALFGASTGTWQPGPGSNYATAIATVPAGRRAAALMWVMLGSNDGSGPAPLPAVTFGSNLKNVLDAAVADGFGTIVLTHPFYQVPGGLNGAITDANVKAVLSYRPVIDGYNGYAGGKVSVRGRMDFARLALDPNLLTAVPGDAIHINDAGAAALAPGTVAGLQSVLDGVSTSGGTGGVVPAAGDVRAGVAVGLGFGTLAVPAPGQVLDGVDYDTDGGVQGTWHPPTVLQVAAGETFGPDGTLVGTFTGSGGGTGGGVNPAPGDVRFGTPVGLGTGTLRVPPADHVLTGTPVDHTTGTVALPPASVVKAGEAYGAANGLVGTYTAAAGPGGGPDPGVLTGAVASADASSAVVDPSDGEAWPGTEGDLTQPDAPKYLTFTSGALRGVTVKVTGYTPPAPPSASATFSWTTPLSGPPAAGVTVELE